MNEKDFYYWAKGLVESCENQQSLTPEQWQYFKNTVSKVKEDEYNIKVSFGSHTDTKTYVTSVSTGKIF